MTTADQYLSTIASKFDSVANRADFIAIARLNVSADYFGDKYELAVALYAAHLLEINTSSDTGGVISSKREGDLQVTYAQGGDMARSTYGSQFEELRRSTNLGGFMVTGYQL